MTLLAIKIFKFQHRGFVGILENLDGMAFGELIFFLIGIPRIPETTP